jgi:hypothetical protein
MRLLRKLWVYARVLPRARRNRNDLTRWMVRRPALLGAIGAYESAVMVSNRLDGRVKAFASLRASMQAGCPF